MISELLYQVRTFLNLLPSSEADSEKFAVDQSLEFSVTEVWSVPYVGTVVNGILNSGRAKTGDAAVRQTVRILEMDHPQGVLRTGDRATVTFEFISHPEFVKVGMKLLFREGKTKVRESVFSLVSAQTLNVSMSVHRASE
ncbi:hypothetical protein C0992_011078 [Termitomyces sp. T32_za158]|nr:hypothetical protein C0992_011078 [Termitomyces sp. T32_za158]